MKKVLAVCVLLGGMAFAQEAATKEERVMAMGALESAMSLMQKGFLRNDAKIVELGASSLKENLKRIRNFVIEPEEANKDFNPRAYAENEVAAMDKLADGIVMYFNQGKKEEARGAFDATLSRCLACHKIIRHW